MPLPLLGPLPMFDLLQNGDIAMTAHSIPARSVSVGGVADPSGRRRRRDIGVEAILRWSFGVEHARFDLDEVSASTGGARVAVGTEYRLMQQGRLGTKVDVSRGRSYPAHDAEVVASVVGHVLPIYAAALVADHARAGTRPDPMVGVCPRFVPDGMMRNRHGAFAATASATRAEFGALAFDPVARRNRKGVVVHDPVRYCPVRVENTPRQIAAARRVYLDWWGYLLTIQSALRAVDLDRHVVTDRMPPMKPWSASAGNRGKSFS